MLIPQIIDAFIDTEDFRELPLPAEGTPAPADGGTGLQVCTAPVDGMPQLGLGGLADAIGFDHWWLDNGEKGAGLGFDESTPAPLDTTMVDQTGDAENRAGAICAPVEQVFPEHANVDLDCVEEAMTPGLLNFGDYGLEGICKDAVDSILAMCDPDTAPAPAPATE